MFTQTTLIIRASVATARPPAHSPARGRTIRNRFPARRRLVFHLVLHPTLLPLPEPGRLAGPFISTARRNCSRCSIQLQPDQMGEWWLIPARREIRGMSIMVEQIAGRCLAPSGLEGETVGFQEAFNSDELNVVRCLVSL